MFWLCFHAREVSISAKSTSPNDQPAKTVDPLASERLALLGRTAGAQLELERVMANLHAASATIPPEIMAQQGELAVLMREIATAGSAELPALQRAAATAVATAANAVQQAQSAHSDRGAAALASAVDASQRAVQSALDYTRSLELQFASADDERAYREREAERRAYIEAQQAKGTPEGSLYAAGATMGQMADAAAHGAGDRPAFQQRWDALVDSTQKLRAQLVRDGKDVSEFERRLREDLREIMRAKGVPDAQIDALLAAHPDNPLQAMKAFVADARVAFSEKEIDRLTANAGAYQNRGAEADSVKVEATHAPVPTGIASARDAMENLRAMGVVATELNANTDPSHGVADHMLPTPVPGVGGR